MNKQNFVATNVQNKHFEALLDEKKAFQFENFVTSVEIRSTFRKLSKTNNRKTTRAETKTKIVQQQSLSIRKFAHCSSNWDSLMSNQKNFRLLKFPSNITILTCFSCLFQKKSDKLSEHNQILLSDRKSVLWAAKAKCFEALHSEMRNLWKNQNQWS